MAAGKTDSPLHMTDVNYAEVKYILAQEGWRRRHGSRPQKILQGLPIDFHSTNRRWRTLAADFKARFKISLADAFAAALAKEKKAELVTGDPEFKPLEKEIKINWLK